MSALGHSRRFDDIRATSALHPKASKIADTAGPRDSKGAYDVWRDVSFSGRY